MSKKSDKRDELEEKRESHRKKLQKLGDGLTELARYWRKEKKKLEEKRRSYEEKLAKIDEKLKDI